MPSVRSSVMTSSAQVVQSDGPRRAWLLCVVLGLGVAALLVWFAAIVPSHTCSGRLPRGSSPFLAYQLARTTADIEAIFGQQDDPCRAAMVAVLDLANKVDLVAFIAVYSGFFASFFLALMRSGNTGIAKLGFVAVVFTLVCDVLETSVQLYITSSLPGSASSLVLLTIGNTGKFLGLSVIGVCAGAAMLARGGLLGRLAGAACLAGGLMVVVGLNYYLADRALPIGNALIALMILIYAALAALRRTGGVMTTMPFFFALLLLASPAVWPADDSATELPKRTQNPVADLISAPFQNNFSFNSGTKQETVLGGS